eukprot:3137615-Rhodomonas_salina.1
MSTRTGDWQYGLVKHKGKEGKGTRSSCHCLARCSRRALPHPLLRTKQAADRPQACPVSQNILFQARAAALLRARATCVSAPQAWAEA